MKKKAKRYKIEAIYWDDHGSINSGWSSLTKVSTPRWECFTAGIVIKETKDTVYITPTITVDPDFEQAQYLHLIGRLKSTITKRKVLGYVEIPN